SEKLYRLAHVEVIPDVGISETSVAGALRRRLAEMTPGWFAGQAAIVEQFRKLFDSDLPLGTLCDILSFTLPLDVEFKQALLAAPPVEERARRLLESKQPAPVPAGTAPRFPPDFSTN